MKLNEGAISQIIASLEWLNKVANRVGQCVLDEAEIKTLLNTFKELTEENAKIGIENFELVCELSRIKADTVRKMQERLTTFFANDETLEYTEVDAEYINEQIVRIAKEIEGERDGN